ncbi:unnamed protein product [Leptidea sinapis]|uniref:DUF4766 domain-containing protein n=1 Tax=Leptidea sinapis TaxID=189913 RepID=A0A5E4QV41_9NEOP|nr:unnamed protein product [Leptidea sinapis]
MFKLSLFFVLLAVAFMGTVSGGSGAGQGVGLGEGVGYGQGTNGKSITQAIGVGFGLGVGASKTVTQNSPVNSPPNNKISIGIPTFGGACFFMIAGSSLII